MSVEQEATNSLSAPYSTYGLDLSSSLSDGTASASDEGQRRVLECAPFPREADLPLCVAAWHGVLHWLRYNDEPVITCLLGARSEKCWPVTTAIDADARLGDLLAEVRRQWAEDEAAWLDRHDERHSGLADQVRCHAVLLHGASDAGDTEFAVVHDRGVWRVDCDASRFSESYQRFAMALWARLVARMLDSPTSALSAEGRFEGAEAYAPLRSRMSGPAQSIEGNLIGRLAGWVSRDPHKPAIVDADGTLSFAQLDDLSTRWALALQSEGVVRGEYVGVAFDRGRRLVAAQLAVLKVGAVFVPLDAAQPAGRLRDMAEDTDMRVVLTERAHVANLREALPDVRGLDVDAFAHRAGEGDIVAPAALRAGVLTPDDPAYVIFTSGSTGRPKGVKVSHGNLLNFVIHMNTLLGAEDTVSQFAPATFDASVGEIYIALLNGATLVILTPERIENPDGLQAYMTEQRVTFSAFPPQYAKHLSPEKLPRQKTLMTAGSAPDHELIRRWQPHVLYVNAYGPTETTILSTDWRATHLPEQNEAITIGAPFVNTEIRVVNRFNQPLPRGAIGELLIGGAGVTQGYLKRDALTRDKFIELDGTRWYRSGDLSCFDDQSRLIFAGRVDNQVKLRGHRLEPGEVETALLTLPGVRHAAVIVVDVESSKQLAAFCVGEAQDEETVRESLGHVLPAWALPNRIVWLHELPVTLNGKTDYRALRARLAAVDETSRPQDYADELEAQIAGIWRGVLQQPNISRDDHFIHLGGDSLTSLVVMSALKRLGYQVTSSQLLSHPRLADFAELLRRSGRQATRDYASRPGSASPSPIQGWFFGLSLEHPGAFCQTLSFESEQPLDAARLHSALTRLAHYHDQLRARFVRDDSQPAPTPALAWRQEVAEQAPVLPAIEAIGTSEADLDAASERCRAALAAQLRIDQSPLFRVALLTTPSRSRVVWVLHHLIMDTISHGILLDDLHHLYDQDGAELEAVLPGKSIGYLDWSDKFGSHIAVTPAVHLAQWQPVLDAVSQAPRLPLAAPAEASATAVLKVSEHRLTREDTARLIEQAPACYRQSPEELVLAATYLALAERFGLERVAIDVEWHGRDEDFAGAQGLDRTVGWFTSVHPLALAVPAAVDLGAWLRGLKEARVAIPQRGRDFYALRYLSRDPSVRAAFDAYRAPQVLFNFSGVVQRGQDGGWRTVPLQAIEMGEGNAIPYALSVESEIRDGELIVGLYFDSSAWAPEQVEALGGSLTRRLREVIAHCVVTGHRRWTPSDFPRVALTQAQVDELPDTVATVYPLTDMQRTMHRHKDIYQVQMAYRMPRGFEEAAWHGAVADWIARHECLRSTIREWSDGQAHQVVLAQIDSPLSVHRVAAGEAKACADALIEQARAKPVHLDRAPLFELQAVDDGGEEFLAVLSIHHIIHDGWSIDLLLSDLLQTYRHFSGEGVQKPAAPLASVADLVVQQQRLQADASWRAYWSGLDWAPVSSQLPTDAQVRESAGDSQRRNIRLYTASLDRELASAVRSRAAALGVTVNSLWLAGYAGLLRYLGGQAQVRCGVIQNGRMEEIAGFETITGCCVNTLPLVLNIENSDTPADVVGRVNAQLERMRAGAAYPLSLIHEDVRPRLDDELFGTLFNIESHRYSLEKGALRPTLEAGYESTNYRFIFGLIEQESHQPGDTVPHYGVRIGYDADLYDEASIAMWLDLYAHGMRQLIDRTDTVWSDLRLLPPQWKQRVLTEWNQTDHAYRSDACLHELIAEQVARTPDAIALVCEDERLSYRELDERANRLARHLRTLGAGPDVVVGLCVERSIDMVVGVLGILKSGSAYAPLDPELPAARLAGMVADVGVKLVVTQDRHVAGPLSQLEPGVRVLRLDSDWPRVALHEATPPTTGATPDHLIYLIFTSGSTGKPKAAMNPHSGLVNLMQWLQATYPLDASDRVLQKTPFSFDVSAMEFFWTLMAGATLIMARPGGHRDPAYLGRMVREHGVTTLHFVPSMLQMFVDEGELATFTSLRRLFASGEALPAALASRFLATSKAELHNLFGPTETAIEASYCPVTTANAAIVPIGRPLWNTRLYIVDDRMEPVPVGVSGELFIGGVAVGRGYHGRPELTAERFIDSPFVPGERLYRTGDLARWRADGQVEYLGRLDHQVKIRGFRIELGEIEHALAAHDNVRQVVVVALTVGERKQLAAYVVARQLDLGDQEAKTRLIQSFSAKLQAELPEYMVPSVFVLVDAIPCNVNGKVDRARLPEPVSTDYVHTAYVEPENERERALWSVWKDVLGDESFGVTDNFFGIGGDSILAIQVVSRAAKQGIALTPRMIVEEKTIRALLAKIAEQAPQQAPAGAVAAAPPPSAAPVLPANAAQGEQRLMPAQLRFLRDRADANQDWHAVRVPLPAGLDRASLLTAMAAVVTRHDALRLKFRDTASGWIAQYRPELLTAGAVAMEEFLSEETVAAGADDGRIVELAATHARLDLKQGRVFHAVRLHTDNGDELLWIVHALVADAVSRGVLAQALQAHFAQTDVENDAASDRYQDWAARLHDHAYSPALESERGYWQQQLAAPTARLAPDFADVEQATEQTTAHLDLAIDADTVSRLAGSGRGLQGLVLAAAARALADWLGADALRVAIEHDGRDAARTDALFDGLSLQGTVGLAATRYPLHLDGLRSELAQSVDGVLARLSDVPRHGLGYEALLLLAHDESLGDALADLDNREADVLLRHRDGDVAGDELRRVGARRVRPYALTIDSRFDGQHLHLSLGYSTEQFGGETIERLGERVAAQLRAIAALGATPSPDRPTSRYPLAGLTDAQAAELEARYPTLEDVYPCTGMQQSMLLFADPASQDGLYVTQLRVDLENVDAARLHRAWQALARRHRVLRTAFVDGGDDAMLQVVLARVELPWREVEARHAATLERLLSDERTRPFDIAAAPLMRLLLARVSDRRHALVWTYHHALIDGWSMALLMEELLRLYDADTASDPPAPAAEYRQYIQWLQAKDPAQSTQYWRDYFDGLQIAASASLPVDASAQAAPSQVSRYEQSIHTLDLPADDTARLVRMAKAEGVSLGTLMLAAWGLLLSKYNAEPEVLFGYTTSGRPASLDGIESMVGLFINSLPLRLAIDGEQTLSSWLKQVQGRQLDHEDHGHVALSDIQRHSGARAGQALFDSLVVVENFPIDRSLTSPGEGEGLRVVDVQGTGRSSFALNLIVYPGDTLTLELAYQPRLFEAATTETLLQRLRQLLIGFARGASQRVSQLSLLSDEERTRAVRDWNDTQIDYPLHRRIPDLFQDQAEARGDAGALVSGGERWSYRQLAARVAAIARWLRGAGVAAGDKVALSLEKEPDLIAAMLGIMRAGAAYVPVAVDCPPERRAFIVGDAGIGWTVTRRTHAAQVGQDAVPLFLEDCTAAGDTVVADEAVADAAIASADATAYVIYTSGTTGMPKGVAISHRNLINFCGWCASANLLKTGDRTTQFAPYTFDASAGEIFGSLMVGAELHLLADSLIQDPRALAQYLTAQDISFSAFPPPYLQQMDPLGVPEGITLLTAGSAPTAELVRQWGERGRYINGYGPTETTILSSAWMRERDATGDDRLSIGRPIANTAMYVVDTVGQLCAPGLLGEIWIGGEGVAQGYVNRPELSAQQFLPDPWRAGGRVYRTGDHGRWLDDGRIEFVGRRDRQVKLRGFRIELGEIESRIREHADVRDAAVLVRGGADDPQLLAWAVHRDGLERSSEAASAFVAELRDFLRRSLPEYMLPQAIVALDRLPLTANGKVDDKALPQPDGAEWSARAYVAPCGPIEDALADIWAAVLKQPREQIGSNAHFFELGGYSLLAMRVVTQARERLGVEIGVADFLAQPVLADFARVIADAGRNRLPPILPVPRDRRLPLSFAQQRLWFLSQMQGVSETYHVPGALRLRGALNRDALRRGLDRIVARHEVLRTRFELANDQPFQSIDAPDRGFELTEHDLRGAANAESRVRDLVDAEAHTPFDLNDGPMARGRLVALADDDHLLLITLHHIVTDAWSLERMVRELGELYSAYCNGADDPLPALAVQYADYAVWQRDWLSGERLQEQVDYWRGALVGAPALLELPVDRQRPAQQEYDGGFVELALDEALTQSLKTLSRQHGATLFMTLLAAWSVVLSRLSGQQDIVIGGPVANRTQAEVEPLIGFFVNTLALRVDVSGEPSVAELLDRVRLRTLEAQRYQQMPFEQVVEAVQPPRSLSHTPIFQVMFNWLGEGAGAVELEGLTVELQDSPHTSAKFDLSLDLTETDGRIVGGLEYATALFDRDTIERWAGYFTRALRSMVDDAQQAAQQLDLLGEAEQALLLKFNDTYRPDLIDRTWVELFDEQAQRTPDRVAVQCEQKQLTYRQLHERSSRLAAALRAHGAGQNGIVALLDHRGTDLLLMIVSVLRAGAAYLPLDPANPLQRWIEILNEAQPALLVVGDTLIEEQGWLREGWDAGRLRSQEALTAFEVADAAGLPRPGLDDLAYVIFTSGTAGKPKGVMIEHRGMINNMRSKFEPLSLSSDDVIAQTASQCFDISVWQFLTALLLGAKLHIVSSEITRDPEALLECLDLRGVTVWEPVPSVMQAVLPYRKSLRHMRWVLPTGEALARELVDRWFEQYPDVPLMNAYGPAECSDDVSFQPIRGPVDRILIGLPVANAHLHIVDSRLRRMPLGAVGEIAVSGPVVGRGYLNRPKETEAAFRPNPYARHAEDARLYLTGDLGRRMPDGAIEYIGRKDFQVKIRGFRIELGEIESCLAQHPAVREAVVDARGTDRGEKQLFAYVTLDTAISVDGLKNHLRALLPDYMIPSGIAVLDAMPLSGNGKVDRTALAALDLKSDLRGERTSGGRIELTLERIWQDVLQTGTLDRGADFIALGGQWLLAAGVVARVRQALGVDVRIADLLDAPVFEDFAQLVASRQGGAPASDDGSRPLSYAQQRWWFLSQQQETDTSGSIVGVLRLRGALDRAALCRALDRVYAGHESLRLRFERLNGEPRAVVAAGEQGFALSEHDLSAADRPEQALQALIEAQAQTSFDLLDGPLVRGCAVTLNADEHALLIVRHPIVAEAWSLTGLLGELARAYHACRAGNEASLPHADASRSSGTVSPHGDYWRKTLSGAPALLELPTDRPRPAQQDYLSRSIAFELDASLTDALNALASRCGTGLFATLLTAWSIVLGRLSGQQDIVLGASAESPASLDDTTFALRVDLSADPSAGELLQRVTQRIGEATHTAPLPFAQVLDAVQPLRSLAHAPLFQAALRWRDAQAAVALDGLDTVSLEPSANHSGLDLDLELSQADGGIRGVLRFAAALFDRDTAERWVGYFERALRAIAQDETRSAARLPLLDEAELHRLLVEWNSTDATYATDRCIHELFEAQVRATPDRIAAADDDEVLTYAQLNARANALAHHLRDLGVQAETRVALCLERSVDLLVALFAVLKSGGCYVPLDPSYPEDRLAYILGDSAPRAILTHSALAEGRLRTLPLDGIETVRLDIDQAWTRKPEQDIPTAEAGLTASSLCYVIYTSGSTGRPKGVMVEHRGVSNYLCWAAAAYRAEQGAVVSSSLSFDATVTSLITPLLRGGAVRLLPEHEVVQHLARHVRDAYPGLIKITPAHLDALAQQVSVDGARSDVGLFVVGGEAFPAATAECWRQLQPGVRMVNEYGPTETVVGCVVYEVPTATRVTRAVPIGRPIANTRIYLLDAYGQPVPTGATGEIHIGGDGVARGYLNRPDLTAERFLDDPFHEAPGARMYKTGDLARYLPDGVLDYLGRTDFQVKIRGFRIELGEIQAQLTEHSAVREALVLAQDGGVAGKRLLAYYSADGAIDAGELRAHLAAVLPDYMLPAAYVYVPEFPLTDNGKIDRAALARMEVRVAEERDHQAPTGRFELALAGIWQELLQIERVGRDDSFFDIGGHSLLAARVVAWLRREFKVEVNIADLFSFPVLQDFARVVEAAAGSDLPPIEPVPREGLLPVSFAQQRLWFLSQMEGAAETYHVPGMLRLHGVLDRDALRRALDRIVERHEMLRTRFEVIAGEPFQRVEPAGQRFALLEHDLQGDPDADQRLRELVDEETVAPFDLSAGPLVRGRLIAISNDEHVLLVTQHHIVTDAWSLGVLVREFGALYNAYRAGREDPLPPLQVQYGDYAVWQRDWLSGERMQEQVRYWRDGLSGAPALLELPTDRPRPAQQEYEGDFFEFALDETLTAGLKALSRRHDTTLFMTLLAGWSIVLSRLAGQHDVVIGSPVANRVQAEIEPLIGFFINTLALRIDLSEQPTVKQLLQQVKLQTLGAQRHQQMPFEQVVEVVQPPRSLAYTSIFQVMFNWENEDVDASELDGLSMTPERAPYVLSKFDMTLDLAEAGGRIAGGVEYSRALFDRETISRHTGYLRRVLQAMVDNDRQSVRQIDLLGEDEKRQMLAFNDTRRPDLIDRTWPELFDAQAALTPERIAVQCEGQQLTYRELHERATQLAAVLRAQGAGPGQVVALLDQRGIDLLVMIIAVLKAGAAYVPLDPTHPPQRWIEILDEARPCLLWVGESLATERRWLKRKWKGGQVSGLDDLRAGETVPADLPLPALGDLAYVIFTSGSTGKPKGVMIEHRGMINNMRSKFEPLSLSADDAIAQTASQCFDISVWQFLTAALLGAKVCIVPSDITRDPEALLDCIDAHGITVWEPVPSVMQAVLPYRKPLPSLRWVLPTGEALSRELVARWFEQYPDVPLMNAYGPAECSDDVSFQPILAPVDRVLIGTPVANAHLHIVDDQLRLAPLGTVGEIAVSGAVVGRGYINRPDETQRAFVPNPHARHEDDGRLYLTGDLGRRLPGGALEYVGRKDFQVKIRGFRIELGEIENCLTQHASVRETVVVARELSQGDKQLVAYVTLDVTVAVDVLKAHLRDALPDYMVPAAIVVLDAMPLNANGKVDRGALPAPSASALQQAEYEAPQSSAEQAIATVWQELLGVPQVGSGDSFFDLGGNSLLLIRMLARLRKNGLTLNVTDVYQLRTVRALAEAASGQTRSLSSWLLGQNWAHKLVALDLGERKATVLLVAQAERAKLGELKRVLGQAASDERPDFVRVCDDIEGFAQSLQRQGVAALALDDADAAQRAFQAQFDRYLDALGGAANDERFPFGAMQRSMLGWTQRDGVEAIEITGWHSVVELQEAFGRLASKQDLLRAVPDFERTCWTLLAPGDIARAAVPHIDLRAAGASAPDEDLSALIDRLRSHRERTPLAYAAAWASVSDTQHYLLIVVDHLIWDGLSITTVQQRLNDLLKDTPKPIAHSYRDYLAYAQSRSDAATRERVDEAFDHAALSQAVAATCDVLGARRDQPLQVARFDVPLAAQEGGAEQAFAMFKRWILQITGLDSVGVVLNHHGRELGENAYFDQVGLFLDKIPFAVNAQTPLSALSERAAYLQKQGIHYVSLEAAAGDGRAPTLPGMAYEVLFNFQNDMPLSSKMPALEESHLRGKLQDYYGLLFEANAGDGRLHVHCAFRGAESDIGSFLQLAAEYQDGTAVAGADCAPDAR